LHPCGQDLNPFLLHKPLDVAQIKVERQWLNVDRFELLAFEIAVNRILVEWIIVPVAGGTEIHAGRHIGLPKIHRLAEGHVLDVFVPGIRRHCQAIRASADDEQGEMFCHGCFLLCHMT
jgi:hypothetical protein